MDPKLLSWWGWGQIRRKSTLSGCVGLCRSYNHNMGEMRSVCCVLWVEGQKVGNDNGSWWGPEISAWGISHTPLSYLCSELPVSTCGSLTELCSQGTSSELLMKCPWVVPASSHTLPCLSFQGLMLLCLALENTSLLLSLWYLLPLLFSRRWIALSTKCSMLLSTWSGILRS